MKKFGYPNLLNYIDDLIYGKGLLPAYAKTEG